MSTVQPQRPGARRPGTVPVTSASKGPSAEEIAALPEFIEDGVDTDLDPSKANDGGFAAGDGTTVTIQKAYFGKFQFNNMPDIAPQVRLFLELAIPGQEKARTESLKYGDFSRYVATKDGNSVKLRPSAVKLNKDGTKYVPSPYKFDQAIMFLQSIKDAGISADKLNKEGAAALVGLKVHVRKRKIAGQSENGKPALVVDYIEGLTAPAAPAATGQTTAPAVVAAPVAQTAAQPASEIDGLAEAALLDLLEGAENKSMARAQIPTTLIRHDKWKTHEHRGSILKTLRDDAFVNHEDRKDVLWKLDGVTISKL